MNYFDFTVLRQSHLTWNLSGRLTTWSHETYIDKVFKENLSLVQRLQLIILKIYFIRIVGKCDLQAVVHAFMT